MQTNTATTQTGAAATGPAQPSLGALGVRQLLHLYADILTELIRRGVIRSRNAPVGDLAERLVADALGGSLAPGSEKSWDVVVGSRRLQVKARILSPKGIQTQTYGAIRSWAFDACVFVLLDPQTYDITRAVEVPLAEVQRVAHVRKWVKASTVNTREPLLKCAGAIDRTAALQAALNAL